jgi:hypothetical protein
MVSASGPGGSFGPAPIGATDTVTLSAIAVGDYTVTLSQVPANCTVTTPPPNPRTVPVPAGGTGSTTFNVTCTAVPGTGNLRVITATTGASIPAGYMVSASGPGGSFGPASIGATDTVTLSAVTAGDYTVTLSQVPANCTVTTPPPNPRTVAVPAGGTGSTTFNVTCTAITGVRITGLGAIGTSSSATPRSDRQEFDFEATDTPGGRLFYRDWSFIRENPDGSVTVPTVTVDPTTDPETGITSFVQTTAACVVFGGRVRISDTREIFDFTIEACDNGSPGAGLDTFRIDLPDAPYVASGTLFDGEITLGTF